MNPRLGRGRHRRPGAAGRGWAAALVVLVATGAVVTTMVMSAADEPSRPVPVPAGAATGAAPDTAAPAALRACETAVSRGREAVAAAGPSYSHWSGHVHAQLDYDAGTATLEQTRQRWATTRATADADLAGFATAHAAFEAAQEGCTPEAPKAPQTQPGPSTPDDPTLTQCRTEFAAVSAAVAAATAVVDDWAAHVAMMKGEEHYGADEYGRMWRDMVAAAPADLDRFATASLAMSDHADCPRPV